MLKSSREKTINIPMFVRYVILYNIPRCTFNLSQYTIIISALWCMYNSCHIVIIISGFLYTNPVCAIISYFKLFTFVILYFVYITSLFILLYCLKIKQSRNDPISSVLDFYFITSSIFLS